MGPPPVAKAPNNKLYSILAYVPLCFLFGMLSNPEKNDPRVRFHVGQGILLNIVWAGLSIISAVVATVLRPIMLVEKWVAGGYWGYGTYRYVPSPAYTAITAVLWIAFMGVCIWLAVMGYMNANKGIEKPLPVIGKMSFYK